MSITQDETGRVTLSSADGVPLAYMSPEVLAVLARSDAYQRRHFSVPQQPAAMKIRLEGGLWLDHPPAAPRKLETRNQRKRWRRSMSR